MPDESALPIEAQSDKPIRVMDLTPTWRGLIPAMVDLMATPLPRKGRDRDALIDAKEDIRHEIYRMARFADLYNESMKAGKLVSPDADNPHDAILIKG